jgi:hypothetical protein
MFIEVLTVKALFTHPNPSFFVREGWPRSVDEHRWVLWVASPLLFTVKVAFLTESKRGYCVFKLKPFDRNKVHPQIAHPINPAFMLQMKHLDT